ncbi:MAG: primosomal protein N' [Thermodesulfovibrionales bacterium]|nr:primosomal protein N' [Thermodesulfovibrionales bacterium]
MFADVILPLRLKTLTYKIPTGIDTNLKGHIVKVPLHNGVSFGLVVNVTQTNNFKDELKDIIEVICYYCNDRFIDFMKWIADYYLSSVGMVLKSSTFDYIVEGSIKNHKVFQKEKDERAKNTFNQTINNLILDTIDNLSVTILTKSYKTLVIRPTCKSQEYAMTAALLNRLSESLNDVIILVPEIKDVLKLQEPLKEIFNDRLVVFHSKMTNKQKIIASMNVIHKNRSIILGTRSALFMPLRQLSLIIVLSESSISYKAEEGLKYNARDIAVRLGYMEDCPVILSSLIPSVETFFNVKAKKYEKIFVITKQRCKIKPVYHSFQDQLKKGLSKEILFSAQKVIEDGGAFLLVSPREGYSLIYCKDCGSVAKCELCNHSVIFYKDVGLLCCLNCQSQRPIHYHCDNCKGYNLVALGSGIERIKDEISGFFNMSVKSKKQVHQINDSLDSLIIGNKSITKQFPDGTIQAGAIIDFDYLIIKYGYKADEVAISEVLNIACLVEPKGHLYLQTSNLKSKLLTFLKDYNFDMFYNYQLELRKSAGYPPYKKLASLTVNIKNIKSIDLIRQVIKEIHSEELEILGPIDAVHTKKGFQKSLKYLLKSQQKRMIDKFIKDLEDKFINIKGIEVIVDVDPIYVD